MLGFGLTSLGAENPVPGGGMGVWSSVLADRTRWHSVRDQELVFTGAHLGKQWLRQVLEPGSAAGSLTPVGVHGLLPLCPCRCEASCWSSGKQSACLFHPWSPLAALGLGRFQRPWADHRYVRHGCFYSSCYQACQRAEEPRGWRPPGALPRREAAVPFCSSPWVTSLLTSARGSMGSEGPSTESLSEVSPGLPQLSPGEGGGRESLSSQRGTKSISLIGHVCVELRGATGFFLLWIH